MENYNLTAEIKKISGAINNSSPNTELGNINSGVGNLDTAMQGVAAAINNKSIPDPSNNIAGVAAAINNKTIPDPNTALGNIVSAIQNINIQAVASDAIAVDGTRWDPAGNYVADLNIFWEGLGHVNTSTLHHPQSTGHGIVIAARNGASAVQVYLPIYAYTENTDTFAYIRMTQYADMDLWYNAWEPLYYDSNIVKYTDTNNIGATDVQGAVDKLADLSTWKYLGAVTGSNHMNYPASWQELWIQCVGPDTTWQNYDFTILKKFIDNANRPANSAFRNGFYVSSSDYAECTIIASATDVYLATLRVSGNNQTSNAVMRVYYR